MAQFRDSRAFPVGRFSKGANDEEIAHINAIRRYSRARRRGLDSKAKCIWYEPAMDE